MKTVIIHGQSHEGSTCHIARMLAKKIGGELTEFFLPRDFGQFCLGCTTCFVKDEFKCPHYKSIKPITDALNEADVIILASPVYVYHATGAMKALLDHYGYRWMPHRPDERMFSKQGVCISTAAGGGMKSANKDMSDSLLFWGVPKIYRLGFAVRAIDWESVDEGRKLSIDRILDKTADKIFQNVGKVRVGPKTRGLFNACRELQFILKSPSDLRYWKKKGWLEGKRPWKG